VSLRARLLLVLAALTVVGLVTADVVTYTELRSFLVKRVDRTVTASANALGSTLLHRGQIDPTDLQQLASSTPGVTLALIGSDDDEPAWKSIGTPPGQLAPPNPKLPATLPALDDRGGATFTVPAESGSTRYRVRVQRLNDENTLVVAAPLTDVSDTLHRLLLIELLVSLGVLAAIVGGGLWLVHLGLRPLRRIEETAGAIAAGDLGQRIGNASERTEVGRLGGALNAMLSQIEQAFAERRASEDRLRRFVADASHELRTPLASVRAYAELFERGAKQRPDDLARSMAGIEREATRMGMLVDDMLLLARLDQGRPVEREPVDLVDVATDAVDAARALQPERRIELTAPEHVVVTGDREHLRRLFDNLLANVRAHTPPSSKAAVAVRAQDGGAALIEVTDDGPGMTEDQAARVFERFYRSDPSRTRDGGGTGLGLAIVAAIAAAHGGSAEVVTSPGHGCTFRIVVGSDGVPVEDADAEEGLASAPTSGFSPRS
jgi:two-component system OmpR family sensor kinase